MHDAAWPHFTIPCFENILYFMLVGFSCLVCDSLGFLILFIRTIITFSNRRATRLGLIQKVPRYPQLFQAKTNVSREFIPHEKSHETIQNYWKRPLRVSSAGYGTTSGH
jgi:hypothetical protein